MQKKKQNPMRKRKLKLQMKYQNLLKILIVRLSKLEQKYPSNELNNIAIYTYIIHTIKRVLN